MLWIFGILLFIAAIVLGIIVLIQNPKGGGLTSSLGGFGNQLMGVKQTTDILEKGTWIFAAIIGFLCITSALFIPKTAGVNSGEKLFQETPVGTPMAPPATVPMNQPSQQSAPQQPAPQQSK